MMKAQEISLKYAADLHVITATGESCPPQDAVECTRTGFHWCMEPMTANCFAPSAAKNPRRLHKEHDAKEKCSLWAISMHVSLEASLAAFQDLEKSVPRLRKSVGDHVASGELQPAHGRQTSLDGNGHFDLHEYAAVDLLTAFAIAQKIPGADNHG